MTKDDRSAFSIACEAASRRAKREGRKIGHVRWRDGHLEVTTSPIVKGGEPEQPGGWELPQAKRSTVRVEQGSLL